jgi:hypothetical protein
MAINLPPDTRDALRDAITRAVADTRGAVFDPEPEDFAEAVMDVLVGRDIIRVPDEGGTDIDPVVMAIRTELDTVILSTRQASNGAETALRLTSTQARQMYDALPLHINAVESYARAVLRDQEG